MNKSKEIKIFDTTLRDGEQVPGCKLNADQKLQIAEMLENLGVNIIEAGFAISSPGDFHSITEISKLVKNSSICALSRAVKKDIEVAAESLVYAKMPRIHTGIGTSDNHIKYKFKSTREKILERAVEAVKYAKTFVEDVEFYAEDAGRTDNEFLAKVCTAVVKAGATVLNIPDTTGYCLPTEYGAKIKYLKENVVDVHKVDISCHCHNDLGLATANTLDGIMNGATQVECTINGMGERAGNTAMEEIVMILNKHKSLNFTTSVNPKLLAKASDLVAATMEMNVAANKAIVGSNAFSHSSGIHQDGFLKEKSTYEIIDPTDVGRDASKIVLTARSGRAALAFSARKAGIELTKNELDIVYKDFLKVADRKKEVVENDIIQIVEKCLKSI